MNSPAVAIIIDGNLKNGGLIPITWWIEHFDKLLTIDLYVLDADQDFIDYFARYRSVNTICVSTNRKNIKNRLKNFKRGSLSITDLDNSRLNKNITYSFVIAGSLVAAEAANIMQKKGMHSDKKLAIVSDSILNTFSFIAAESNFFRARALAFFKMCYVKLSNIELKILESWDHIILQTHRDRETFINEYGRFLLPKIKCLPNGKVKSHLRNTSDKLFHEREVDILIWADNWKSSHKFSKKFIRYLDEQNASFNVEVLGSVEISFLDSLKVKPTRLAWVPDIDTYLKGVKFLIVPEFKNFGLINRLVDGMHAGCIVFSSGEAFDGLTDFENGVHGFKIVNVESMFITLSKLMLNNDGAQKISNRAYNLMLSNHGWAQHEEFVQQIKDST